MPGDRDREMPIPVRRFEGTMLAYDPAFVPPGFLDALRELDPAASARAQQARRPRAVWPAPGRAACTRSSLRRRPTARGTSTAWSTTPCTCRSTTPPFAPVDERRLCDAGRRATPPASLATTSTSGATSTPSNKFRSAAPPSTSCRSPSPTIPGKPATSVDDPTSTCSPAIMRTDGPSTITRASNGSGWPPCTRSRRAAARGNGSRSRRRVRRRPCSRSARRLAASARGRRAQVAFVPRRRRPGN